jgi:hypothetical protein
VQPLVPAQPNAWNQPELPPVVQPASLAPGGPTGWGQPVQPTWGAPVAPAASTADGLDSLFGAPTATQAPAQAPAVDTQPGQWGLTPTTGGDQETRRRGQDIAGSSTFWAWLIAISPILAAGSIAYVLLTTKSALTSWPFEAAVAAPYLLVLLFALADRSALLQLGHEEPRSPAWALATAPIYLIQRASETRRADGSGTALTLVWFASFIVAVGGIVGYGLLTHQALITGLPT